MSIDLSKCEYYDKKTERIYIDPDTGEVVKVTPLAEVPEGTRIITPEQQSAIDRKKAMKNFRERSGANYFFVPTHEDFNGVSPESATRLIYLSTFITDYDGNNKLMRTQRKPMLKKDLPDVLRLSRTQAYRFWKEVNPKYLTEDEGGTLRLNVEVFKHTKLNKARYVKYQRFYNQGIRSLYDKAQKQDHKKLGYLFKLLPYINIEYNLVCSPEFIDERDIDKIRLLTLAEFCGLIGYDITHVNRLITDYNGIRFSVTGGRQERFCSFVYDGINRDNARIFINPHVLYSGSDYRKVKALGAFCRE